MLTRTMTEAFEKAEATIQDELAYSFFEGKVEVAKSMLRDGDSLEKVARCTGLPLEQIQELKPQ